MKRRRLLWQIFPPMVIVLIVTIVGGTLFVSRYGKEFYLTQTVADLAVRTHLVLKQVRGPLLANELARVHDLCQVLGREAQARITIILADGTVVADSQEEPKAMDNHADRAEVVTALAGGTGFATRFSRTIQTTMLYVALPYTADPESTASQAVRGVIRLSIPLTPVERLLREVFTKIALASLFLLLVAALVTLSVSRRISRPLEEMQRIAERLGRHDFTRKIPVPGRTASREVAGLAEALNQMADELEERIRTVTQQKNELEAVFTSMIEAVIVIDQEERIEQLNEAARRLLGRAAERGIGRPIVETVRHAELLQFVRETLASAAPVSREIGFGAGVTEQHFNASGTVLFDGQGHGLGAVIVLHDITTLRRLETMRREFVANVSHELKTPITSIKGFVETICDQAPALPEEMERFLHIVLKQANRLNDIVDDLLSLSRIEQEAEQHEIDLRPGRLAPVLRNCIEAGAIKAGEKAVTLSLACDSAVSVRMNARLLEQAVTNLLINAIKYSPEGGEVRIAVGREGEAVRIAVTDSGCGIAQEHLPRIFERFYRSDKARSRKLGGTGLGLAIVKHIVQAHGGTVAVASEVGRGSVFTIHLPLGY